MKKHNCGVGLVPLVVLVFSWFCLGSGLDSQATAERLQGNTTAPSHKAIATDDSDFSPAPFKGVIVRAGEKVVLLDTVSRTSYQLDDQEKAREFLNQTVKVAGVLDASTGTIRVRAIHPASE